MMNVAQLRSFLQNQSDRLKNIFSGSRSYYDDIIECLLNGKGYSPPSHSSQTGKITLCDVDIDLLRVILAFSEAEKHLHPYGIRWCNLRFTTADPDASRFDLSYSCFNLPIALHNCHFDRTLILRSSRLGSLDLRKSTLVGLDLRSAKINGQLLLDNCFLVYNDRGWRGPTPSLEGDGLTTTGRFSFRECVAIGGINLAHADIGGDLDGAGACLINRHYANAFCSYSPDAERTCQGCLSKINWSDISAFSVLQSEIVKACHAKAQGQPGAARYAAGPYDPDDKQFNALRLFNGFVHGSVLLDNTSDEDKKTIKPFRSIGETSFNSTRIDGGFFCRGARLFQEDGVALSIDGIDARLSVYLEPERRLRSSLNEAEAALHVNGTISMRGASIAHRFICNVDHHFRDVSASTRSFSGNPFRERELYALFGKGALVGGDFLYECTSSTGGTGVSETGRIFLENAHIGGRFSFIGAPLAGADSIDFPFLKMDFAEVAASLDLKIQPKSPCHASLRSARAGSIDLSKSAHHDITWDLEGLTYAVVENLDYVYAIVPPTPSSPNDKWIDVWKDQILSKGHGGTQSSVRAIQPFEQFSSILRESGYEDAAVIIGVAKQDAITKRVKETVIKKQHFHKIAPALKYFWRWLIAGTVCYGYRPERGLMWLMALVAFGSIIFSVGARVYPWVGLLNVLGQENSVGSEKHAIFPTKAFVYTGMPSRIGEYYQNEQLGSTPGRPGGGGDIMRTTAESDAPRGSVKPDAYPNFDPIVYSFELATPIPDLGQESNWDIKGENGKDFLFECYKWFHVFVGWLLSFLIVLSPTKLLRMD